MKKITILMMLLSLLVLAACGGSGEAEQSTTENTEPAVTESESVEEMAEEEMAEEEMDGDHSDEEMTEEDHSDEEMMEEESEGEMAEEEMAEGEAVYTVNNSESAVIWTGSKPVGASHSGFVDIQTGELVVEEGELVSGQFVLDMQTIRTTDDMAQGMIDRLEGHLKSDDFFAVDTYPTATLELKSAEKTGDNTYTVVADLTIKETTEEIVFEATVEQMEDSIIANADIVFDRAVYNVQYGSGSFFSDLGDDLINDEIQMSVSIVAQN